VRSDGRPLRRGWVTLCAFPQPHEADLTALPGPSALDEVIDVSPILGEVERRLHTQVASSNRFVDQAARYLASAGGKRFRPMLVALTGHLGEPDPARLADGGVVVELIHLATLYHDDVMDDADVRRGAVAANIRWDNTVAILTGDYLFARAAELSADLGVEATRIVARTIATLCEGQIREVQGSRGALPPDIPRLDPDLDHYLAVISEKTASLVATSCRFGTLLAGCSPAEIEAATDYGWNLGMAFQLSDDVLDLASPHEVSGKTPGTDLRQGVRTLPVIYALEDDPTGELQELLSDEDPSEEAVTRALELLRDHPALDRAREDAASYAEAAVAQLDAFRGSSALRALRHIADYTVVRTS
jgi:heptaprenyl diphosphate synthase